MNSTTSTPPKLEERFTEPKGWRWHQFTRNNRTIRFGSVFPEDNIPDAVVVCLPGLSEFSEKYFEIARTCLDKNLAFWVLDWMGQGRSGRYLENPHKRHAHSFQEDVDDLHYFVMEYIKHSSVHPDKGRIPLAMLAHSMGANIGMRYLQQHPDRFECAAFTAPMFGIKAFSAIPAPLHLVATSVCQFFADKRYVPGDGDWRKRDDENQNKFSNDEVRREIHDAWCNADPSLQVGHVTFGWVHRAASSCFALQSPKLLKSIHTHCLIAKADHEDFVDNNAISKVSKKLSNAQLVEYPDAAHEILMEKDNIRDDFFDSFYKLIKEHIIDVPETLKPF